MCRFLRVFLWLPYVENYAKTSLFSQNSTNSWERILVEQRIGYNSFSKKCFKLFSSKRRTKIMSETFGQRLSRLRKEKGLTQEDIAKRIIISPQAVAVPQAAHGLIL